MGKNILGSHFSFDLHLGKAPAPSSAAKRPPSWPPLKAGAASLAPAPLPAVSGLWNKPSNVNNVKSYTMTPQIILNGANWFAGIGTPKSPGTAIFALTGKISNTGLIEVPMGISLGEIIFDVGGGVPDGKTF